MKNFAKFPYTFYIFLLSRDFFVQQSWKLTEHYQNFLCAWKIIFPKYLLIATCLCANFSDQPSCFSQKNFVLIFLKMAKKTCFFATAALFLRFLRREINCSYILISICSFWIYFFLFLGGIKISILLTILWRGESSPRFLYSPPSRVPFFHPSQNPRGGRANPN